MRELFYDMVDLSNQIGRPATCVYWILVRTVPPPVSCESYGVCITMLQTGEREEVLDITVRPERILSLAQMLAPKGVVSKGTPPAYTGVNQSFDWEVTTCQMLRKSNFS